MSCLFINLSLFGHQCLTPTKKTTNSTIPQSPGPQGRSRRYSSRLGQVGGGKSDSPAPYRLPVPGTSSS
ncbi:hypothetical protein [Kamptonema formosum]|uniref:hypothetical protein n=1 Tax=Kamptonema formosum TaxID=331992 RepID=UPI0012DE3E4E|nr:hypothetical protein [Oscillatoria sp. PCC 10802]